MANMGWSFKQLEEYLRNNPPQPLRPEDLYRTPKRVPLAPRVTPDFDARHYIASASNVLGARAQTAINAAIKALPMRVLAKIAEIRFGPDGSPEPAFEVVWHESCKRQSLLFTDIDAFPTDTDITRIVFEAP